MKIKIKYPAWPVAPEDGTGVNPCLSKRSVDPAVGAPRMAGFILSKKTETYKLMNPPFPAHKQEVA